MSPHVVKAMNALDWQTMVTMVFFAVLCCGASSVATVKTLGHPACPCSSSVTDEPLPMYGFGCAPHDSALPQCSSLSLGHRPDYCESHWCWVNGSTCNLSQAASLAHPSQHYSYATCGFLNTWADQHILQGKVLKALPLENSGGWQGTYCTEDGECRGPVLSFYESIANAAGFEIQYQKDYDPAVLQAIDRLGISSKNMKCFLATGMGFVDLCPHEATLTPERLALSSSITIRDKPLHLIVLKQPRGGTDHLTHAFRPFNGRLWVVLLFGVIFLALVLTFQEWSLGHKPLRLVPMIHLVSDHGLSISNYGDLVQTSIGTASNAVKQISSRGVVQASKTAASDVATVIADATYHGLLSFFGGNPSMEPRSWGAKFTYLGFSFLAMVMLATYTANLATFLVLQPSDLLVGSLDDVIQKNVPLCATSTVAPVLQKLKPGLKNYLVIKSGSTKRSDVLKSLTNRSMMHRLGYCGAAVAAQEDIDIMQHRGQLCDVVVAKEAVMYSLEGQAVNSRYASALNYWKTKALREGIWSDKLEEFRKQSICAEDEPETMSMTVDQMAGPLALTGLCAVVGVAITIANMLFLGKAERVPKSAVLEPRCEPTSSPGALQAGEQIGATDISL